MQRPLPLARIAYAAAAAANLPPTAVNNVTLHVQLLKREENLYLSCVSSA